MNALENMAMKTSPEAEIIRQIEDLIRQLASGPPDEEALQRLHELQRRRVEMMSPKILKRRMPA